MVHRVHLGGGSCFSSACLDHLQRTLYIATLSGSVVAVDAVSAVQLCGCAGRGVRGVGVLGEE